VAILTLTMTQQSKLNFIDLIAELSANVYGSYLYPKLEIKRRVVLEEDTINISIYFLDHPDCDKMLLEKIVLDLRNDFPSVVDSILLSKDGISLMCKM